FQIKSVYITAREIYRYLLDMALVHAFSLLGCALPALVLSVETNFLISQKKLDSRSNHRNFSLKELFLWLPMVWNLGRYMSLGFLRLEKIYGPEGGP
ncbi:hypothetical protein L9F63_014714, partial [Diploptera punctata]